MNVIHNSCNSSSVHLVYIHVALSPYTFALNHIHYTNHKF